MTVNKITDKLPENNQYVLAHLTLDNWGDDDDLVGNRYWVVVKFRKGLSKIDREALCVSNPRKRIKECPDEADNNLKPYCWDSFGPSQYYGQDVDLWCELPGLGGLNDES